MNTVESPAKAGARKIMLKCLHLCPTQQWVGSRVMSLRNQRGINCAGVGASLAVFGEERNIECIWLAFFSSPRIGHLFGSSFSSATHTNSDNFVAKQNKARMLAAFSLTVFVYNNQPRLASILPDIYQIIIVHSFT